MITCLLCQQNFVPQFNFLDLFKFSPLKCDKLCRHCLCKFKPIIGISCKLCGKEMDEDKTDQTCNDCKNWQNIYQGNTMKNYTIYHYNDAFHDLMVNYKRYGDYVLKDVFQELIKLQFSKLKYEYYVPVPTSPEHFQKRKFDTITEIYCDLVNLTPLLKKHAGHSAQGEKNKLERMKTQQGFYVDNQQAILDNRFEGEILLLDDIYTTGRTLYHARDALLENFPLAKIDSFSICH